MQKRPRRPRRARCWGQTGGPRPNRRPRGRLRDSCWNSLASSKETTAQQVHLAAQAVAEGRVQKGGDERQRRCSEPEPAQADREPDNADRGEAETDRLGESRRRLWFAFSWRTESLGQRVPKQQAVRGAAQTAERSDGEHRGLHGEHDPVAGQQYGSENDCSNRRGEPQSAWIYESGRTGHGRRS